MYLNKKIKLKIAAIIPAFNEEKSIEGVVKDIGQVAAKSGYEIIPIVVNDCSTDNTGVKIDGLNCVAIHLPINLGIGGAVQTGYRFALENNFDFAVQVDGDGQHPAEYIPFLYEALTNKKLDVVIGSRYLSKKGFQSSSARRAGIKYFKWLNQLLTGLSINDTTSGFRMLNKKALTYMTENYPDEYPEPETIILYKKLNLSVSEIPVQMRARQGGVSSINLVSSVYYMVKVSLAILFTQIRKIKIN